MKNWLKWSPSTWMYKFTWPQFTEPFIRVKMALANFWNPSFLKIWDKQNPKKLRVQYKFLEYWWNSIAENKWKNNQNNWVYLFSFKMSIYFRKEAPVGVFLFSQHFSLLGMWYIEHEIHLAHHFFFYSTDFLSYNLKY